jgi:hypothetical protein
MSKIGVLCPIHRRPDLILEQLKNYANYSDNRCFHVLHCSKDGVVNFNDDFRAIVREIYGVFCDNAISTSWRCVMGAFIECTNKIKSADVEYVYLHTDGDLIIKGNLRDYVTTNRIAYSGSHPEESWNWPHYDKMLKDVRFRAIRESLGISDSMILVGRQEGSFFPKDVWLQIVEKITEYYNNDFFEDLESHWPVEEALIPTLASFYAKGQKKVRNIVKTKEMKFSSSTGNQRDNPENCVTVKDLQEILDDGSMSCIGMKWFSQNLDDEARCFLKKEMNK